MSDVSASETAAADEQPADERAGDGGDAPAGGDERPDAPVGDGGAGDDEPGDDGGDGGAGQAGGLSWARALVLAAALAFLGFAVGLVVSRDRPPGADSADASFMLDMLTHHEQALGVATIEVAHGRDATVRSYAREVLTFQSYEVGAMEQKLRDWDIDPGDRPDEAMAWMDMPVPAHEMPGLLSPEQLDRMAAARGADADAAFLELMAEHHRGGLHMAQAAAGRVDDADVRALAARIAANQAEEINEYRSTAADLGFDLDIAPAEVAAPAPD